VKPIHWVVVVWGLGWLGFFQMLAVQPLSLFLMILAAAWGLILLGTGRIRVDWQGRVSVTGGIDLLVWIGFGLGVSAPFIIEHFLGT